MDGISGTASIGASTEYYNGTKLQYNAAGKIDEKNLSEGQIRELKRSGKIECEACKNRKYQDGSDDATVSFQTPSNISPAESAGKSSSFYYKGKLSVSYDGTTLRIKGKVRKLKTER